MLLAFVPVVAARRGNSSKPPSTVAAVYVAPMPAAKVTLEVLPAGYGDCLLVTCPVGQRSWRMLVDTGPDECWPMLRERLAQVPVNAKGQRHLDLVVITHIDHDHIGGASALFGDNGLGLTFGDVWFNAPTMPAARGVAEGRSLATILGGSKAMLPWNKAWGGRHAVTPVESPFVELPSTQGQPRITVLSPTPEALVRMFNVWDKELLRLRQPPEQPPAHPVARDRGVMDLEALARKATAVDRAPANGSSITLLLEHKGVSILLGADAHAAVLVPALQALAAHRRQTLPLRVDAFKLSHHGSRANITTDLFRAVQAEHYIVSTNGAIFRHPDDEAVARVIVGSTGARTLWFNFENDRHDRWREPALLARYGYEVAFPTAGTAGLKLAF